MSSAYKCDRCKKFCDGTPDAYLTLTPQKDSHLYSRFRKERSDGDWHLCDDCNTVIVTCLNPPDQPKEKGKPQ